MKATESIKEKPAVLIKIKEWGQPTFHMKTFYKIPIRPEHDYNVDQMKISYSEKNSEVGSR